MYILFAILAFGLLILTHELGHFLAAKACHVQVLEFSVGMGPQLLHFQGKETEYSLRLFPMGGYCAMEGEDDDSDDPRAFRNQSPWKRMLILVAGAAMNFLVGFLLVCAIYAGSAGFYSPTVDSFYPDCPYEGDILPGDTIYRVNGERVYFTGNFSEYVSKTDEPGRVDLVLLRDGKKLRLEDYPLVPVEYTMEDRSVETKYGFYFRTDPMTVGNWLRYSWYSCMDFVRMVRLSLSTLLSGGAKMSDVSGAVGMVDIISDVGEQSGSAAAALSNMTYLIAFIAVNLAVMNLLPIPALDGGRVFTLLLTVIYEAVFRTKADPRIEKYFHAAGMILLLGLMAVVMYNDIVRIIQS